MATTPEKIGFRERLRQIGMAFSFTRRHDKRVIPLLLAAFGIPLGLAICIAVLTGWWLLIPLGVLVAVLSTLIVFSRRVTKATYAEVEGQPGAAAAILQSMRGNWRLTQAVIITPQQDLVHRVVGRPGVILVHEGSTRRLRNLIIQEKKMIARVAPEIPIYDVVVGDGEGEIPLRKLQSHFLRMPRNITPRQIGAVEQRLSAMGGARLPIPKGPIPKSARAMKGAKQQMYRGR